jgi:hypothetical protein
VSDGIYKEVRQRGDCVRTSHCCRGRCLTSLLVSFSRTFVSLLLFSSAGGEREKKVIKCVCEASQTRHTDTALTSTARRRFHSRKCSDRNAFTDKDQQTKGRFEDVPSHHHITSPGSWNILRRERDYKLPKSSRRGVGIISQKSTFTRFSPFFRPNVKGQNLEMEKKWISRLGIGLLFVGSRTHSRNMIKVQN